MTELFQNKYLRESDAVIISGMSRTTRWRLEQKGEFPKRYQISAGITAYKLSEVIDWFDTREIADYSNNELLQ